MKILQVMRAADLLVQRQELREHMDADNSGLRQAGRHFDGAMVAALAGAYWAELRKRLNLIEQELIGLGVDLNSPIAERPAA